MDELFDTYNAMKDFLSFDDSDAARLKALAPVFAKHGAAITNAFYDQLGAMPSTAKIIDGRVEALKRTHIAWMGQLFDGEYGRPFFDRQFKIGDVHVTNNINPEYVEGVTTTLRLGGRAAIIEEMGNTNEALQHFDSLVKVLDLALMTINLAYQEERLSRISAFTGMSRKLLENLVKRGGKKK
ncbi:MAG: hypothetical protein H6737_14925 [Alphaproteobacteria bacterium]|nr:hypothetical protein [Alphaproteobacteria bacterium]